MSKYSISENEHGFGMIEMLVAVVLTAILFMGVTKSVILSFDVHKHMQVTDAAFELAVSKVEQLSAVNTANLDDADDETESSVSYAGFPKITFTRSTNITVNADNSRTLEVIVSSNDPYVQVTRSYEVTLSLWE